MDMDNRPENCRQVLAVLSEYLDFELPPEACDEIERHLSGCAPCEEFAESLRQTVALCRTFESRAMPGPLSAETRRRLEIAWQKMLSSRT